MNNNQLTCVNRHCAREAMINNLCTICATAHAADRADRAVTYRASGTTTLRSDDAANRAAALRSERRAKRAKREQADAEAAKLAGTRAKYGDDAVHDAILASLLRREANPLAAGYSDARGQRSHALTANRRRNDREMKYADAWTPTDPTGDAAIREGDDRALLQADTFTYATRGRRGAAVDYVGLAAATFTDVDTAKVRVAAAVDHARPNGDIVKRARACGMDVGSFHIAARDYRPDTIGRTTMVADHKPARVLAPVPGTGRIK